MRLANSAHTTRPWRIHGLTRDFRLYDVWALPTPDGPDDFPRLVRQMSTMEPSFSGAARALWELREKIGELLGWDRPDAGLGSRVPTLRDLALPDGRRARCRGRQPDCKRCHAPGLGPGRAATAARWPYW